MTGLVGVSQGAKVREGQRLCERQLNLSPGQGEKPRKCAVSRVLGPMWRADAVSRVLVRPMAQSRNAEASARE